MKTCKKQLHYYPDEVRRCPECRKSLFKTYYINNRDQYRLNSKIYYAKNREQQIASTRNWQQLNKELVKTRVDSWKKANRGKVNAYEAKYRAKKLGATPKWLTHIQRNQIASIYSVASIIQKLTKNKIDVDHMVPLQGVNVSGLHVPWNLQLLLANKNRSKGNNYE